MNDVDEARKLFRALALAEGYDGPIGIPADEEIAPILESFDAIRIDEREQLARMVDAYSHSLSDKVRTGRRLEDGP